MKNFIRMTRGKIRKLFVTYSFFKINVMSSRRDRIRMGKKYHHFDYLEYYKNTARTVFFPKIIFLVLFPI